MRVLASSSSSSRLPKVSAPLGHTAAQAGCKALGLALGTEGALAHERSGLLVLVLRHAEGAGHHAVAAADAAILVVDDRPAAVFSSALTGQAEAQAGSTQCMHCCFTNRGAPSSPLKRFTTENAVGEVSRCASKTAGSSLGAGRWFTSEHATSHARQPRHLVASTSTPGNSRRGPDAEAERDIARTPAPPAAPARTFLRLSLIKLLPRLGFFRESFSGRCAGRTTGRVRVRRRRMRGIIEALLSGPERPRARLPLVLRANRSSGRPPRGRGGSRGSHPRSTDRAPSSWSSAPASAPGRRGTEASRPSAGMGSSSVSPKSLMSTGHATASPRGNTRGNAAMELSGSRRMRRNAAGARGFPGELRCCVPRRVSSFSAGLGVRGGWVGGRGDSAQMTTSAPSAPRGIRRTGMSISPEAWRSDPGGGREPPKRALRSLRPAAEARRRPRGLRCAAPAR